MKNKILAVVLLVATSVALSSCFTSRSKYGCPSAPAYNAKFRG